MSTITLWPPVADETRPPLYKSLFAQVVVALLLGVALGMAAPDFAQGLKVLSDAFLKLISMIVAPIVFCVAAVAIAAWEGDLDRDEAHRVLDGHEVVDVTAG